MTSKAVIAENYISREEDIHVVNVPRPKADGEGMVLVKIIAAGINPVDNHLLRGYMKDMIPGWNLAFPFTPGLDFSGIVEEVAGGVSEFKVGDEVCGLNWAQGVPCDPSTPHAKGGGAFAEYMAVHQSKLNKKPAEVSFEVAGSLGVVGVTAYEALVEKLQLVSGQKVLILGGSSSVGMVAIQLAKILGAHVVTTASTRNVNFVSQFGADRIVNYQEQKWEEDPELRNYDIVFDCIGEKNALERAVDHGVVKEGGGFLSIANFEIGFDPSSHPKLRYCAALGASGNKVYLGKMLDLVAEGKLSLPIDETFPLTTEGAVGIMKKINSGKSVGKNIIKTA